MYHAVGDAVADNLVDNVPGGDGRAHTLYLLLNVLRDDIVDEVAGRDTAREPRLQEETRKHPALHYRKARGRRTGSCECQKVL
jgi:hypothetical protein